ncbi:MAG: hypothetical protein JWP97_4339 [Labilithrix sp.]|nr:hypothetical protein [Labilithrix sp.]
MFLTLARSVAITFTALTLAGCYDLSDPTGPSKADFARTGDESDQGAATATDEAAECAGESCPQAAASEAPTFQKRSTVSLGDAGAETLSAIRAR